ncbi:hypothetical protein WICMUC_002987 [Wickerhamomyces mucosus]|uniref:Protein kinase domain-containing protein n=1 Tax=Wickerhamomyces mucosus TaxID=1378264 RepID=A0A9P8PNT8_9ASCO|nr:hypothetical protein WICMUC_002987 [Wickerhamomyces mucosus]
MSYDEIFPLEEEEEERLEDQQLYQQFQDSLNITDELDIPNRSFRKNSSASNRNTPSHRLGTSYEIEISSSVLKNDSHLTLTTLISDGKPKPSDFESIKVLGVGSYGKVILVREKKTGKLFAQKQLKKASLVVQAKTVERTLNERSILKQVHHPSIVKLYYAFQDLDKLYLILQYLDGGELFQHLQQEKFLSETNAAVYLAQIILALEHLHEIGIVYRDLKPENCLLDSNGFLILTDFGLSKVGLNDQELCTSLIGTPEYMAPEILQDTPYDCAVDFWSLGCVMYDMLTGSPPFTGNNNKRIMDKILQNKLKVPFYLSNEAKDLLLRLLKKSSDKRLTNFVKLKAHPFFRKINWDDIESQNFEPPIIPIITDPILAENFDSEFTNLHITPVGSPRNIFKSNANDPFHGFSYTDTNFKHIYS